MGGMIIIVDLELKAVLTMDYGCMGDRLVLRDGIDVSLLSGIKLLNKESASLSSTYLSLLLTFNS